MKGQLDQKRAAVRKETRAKRPAPAASTPKPINSDTTFIDHSTGEILVESLEGIQPKPVRWLVPGRIPAGMLGLLAGEGGHGKSVTTLELAAAVTTGRCALGIEYPNPPKGKVLLISCEDDWERTIIPRLAVFGADFTKVLRIKGVKSRDGQLDFHLGHFAELKKLLETDPEIVLIVIDPAGAYIGRAGVNESRDADVRSILGPLSETTNATGATCLLVKHLNKSAGVSAVQRVRGSAGYVNAVRFAYIVAPDPEDDTRKFMLAIKANVLPPGQSGLAYRLEPLDPDEARKILRAKWPTLPANDLAELSQQLFRQGWESGIDVDPNTVTGNTNRKPERKAEVEECSGWLRDFLGSYSWPDKELVAEAARMGFSEKLLKAAKAEMRRPEKTDPNRFSSGPREKAGEWWAWIGPQRHPCPDRPEDHRNRPHLRTSLARLDQS